MAAPSKFTEEAQVLALQLAKGGTSSADIAERLQKELGVEVSPAAVRQRLVQWKRKPRAPAPSEAVAPPERAPSSPPAEVAAPRAVASPSAPQSPLQSPLPPPEGQLGGTTEGDLVILDDRIRKLCNDADATEDVKARGALLGHLVRMLTVREKMRPPPALDPVAAALEAQRKADEVILQIERYVTTCEQEKPA